MSEKYSIPKTATTALLVVLGTLVPYLGPGMERFRLVTAADLALASGSFRGAPRVPLLKRNEALVPVEGLPMPGLRLPETAGPRTEARPKRSLPTAPLPLVPIEDPSNELGRFFDRLEAVEERQAGALVRITHLGDSPLTGDLISGEARQMLQAELGDGGPGFVLAGRPWGWYSHLGIRIEAKGWTALSPLLRPGNEGHHGLGLVSFTSPSDSARSEIRRENGTFNRAEVTFSAAPGRGTLLVSIDGGPEQEVPTSASERRAGHFAAVAPGGATRIALRPKGDGDVTLYGVVLETDGPGLVYDAVGANGASIQALNLLDESDWIEALALRRSDLVILNYGTNESTMEGIGGPRYEREYAEAIRRVRTALPNASVLVMAPMDRGVRLEDGSIGTLPSIRRLVSVQRRIAKENGCAYFDTFAAMGGEGTMGRWYENDPRLVTGDFTHTTKPGSDRVARLFVGALRAARVDSSACGPSVKGTGPAAKGRVGAPVLSPPREAGPPPS
ncbi:MAG TPA: GDSL-type esterase/lipase family protein [Thermoanaerobaculia bacterium]|nr:GDSL-type esterase/lipase family protein [Thermoanaerobaculia bacterium]